MELPEPPKQARVYLPPGAHSDTRAAEHWFTADQMRAYGEQCALAERERCARLAQTLYKPDGNDQWDGGFDEGVSAYAAAIRKG